MDANEILTRFTKGASSATIVTVFLAFSYNIHDKNQLMSWVCLGAGIFFGSLWFTIKLQIESIDEKYSNLISKYEKYLDGYFKIQKNTISQQTITTEQSQQIIPISQAKNETLTS